MIRAGVQCLASRRRSRNAVARDSSATIVAMTGGTTSRGDTPWSSAVPLRASVLGRSPLALDACLCSRDVGAARSARGGRAAPGASSRPKDSVASAPLACREARAPTLAKRRPGPALLRGTSATACASGASATPPVRPASTAGTRAPPAFVGAATSAAAAAPAAECSAGFCGAADDVADVVASPAGEPAATCLPAAAASCPVAGAETSVVVVLPVRSPNGLAGEWTAPAAAAALDDGADADATVCVGWAA
jgi:hypothetical protein